MAKKQNCKCISYAYLLINKLQLHGIGLWVHVDGYIPHTSGLILHQEGALWKGTKGKIHTDMMKKIREKSSMVEGGKRAGTDSS